MGDKSSPKPALALFPSPNNLKGCTLCHKMKDLSDYVYITRRGKSGLRRSCLRCREINRLAYARRIARKTRQDQASKNQVMPPAQQPLLEQSYFPLFTHYFQPQQPEQPQQSLWQFNQQSFQQSNFPPFTPHFQPSPGTILPSVHSQKNYTMDDNTTDEYSHLSIEIPED